MYTVKCTYEKAGADVLLEHCLGPTELAAAIYSDSRVLDMTWVRSDDRGYGECFISFESEEFYQSWHQDNKENHEELMRLVDEYCQEMKIKHHRIFPPYNNFDWLSVPGDSRVSLSHVITYEQIFE